jgi:type II secretory pathway pseudopilin PulG
MLVVVTITGILAMIGVMLFRKYIGSSKGTEAMAVIQAIRAAEEGYMAENHVYLNVSTPGNWYPNPKPNQTRWEWHAFANSTNTHPDRGGWASLGAAVNRPVQFGFLVNAGIAGKAMPALSFQGGPTYATPTDDWYLIQAEGDTDGNGKFAQYVTASAANQASAQIWSQNEGE